MCNKKKSRKNLTTVVYQWLGLYSSVNQLVKNPMNNNNFASSCSCVLFLLPFPFSLNSGYPNEINGKMLITFLSWLSYKIHLNSFNVLRTTNMWLHSLVTTLHVSRQFLPTFIRYLKSHNFLTVLCIYTKICTKVT